jgi:hypothetical protein
MQAVHVDGANPVAADPAASAVALVARLVTVADHVGMTDDVTLRLVRHEDLAVLEDLWQNPARAGESSARSAGGMAPGET